MSHELGDPPRGRGAADAGALGASAAEGDLRAPETARAAGGPDDAKLAAPRMPSAPPSEPRRPSLPPAPATVPRPITRPRDGASQPPPAAAPAVPVNVVPAAPRAPDLDAFQDPYDGEVTTTYDPYGDDAPTADYDPRSPLYDPRARGTYSSPLPGGGASRSPSAPPPVPSLASEPPPTTRLATPPRPTGGPPSSQKRRSSRRTVRIPNDAPERLATPTSSAAVSEPPTPLDELTPEPETIGQDGGFDESMRIMPMRIVSIGSEPPGRLPAPSRPPPPPVSPPPPPAIAKTPSLPPEVVNAPRDVLEQGWTPLPPSVADAQPTLPVLPAVTDQMLAEAGLTERALAERALAERAAAEQAERRLAEQERAEAARVAEASRKAAEVARAAAAAADAARGEAASVTAATLPPEAADMAELDDAALADSEPEPELEVIEAIEAARPPPPPARPAPPQRPATPPPSAAAPVAPAATAPAAAPAAAPASVPAEESAKKPKAWWDDLFGDDYIRTFDRLEPRHVKREVDFIEESLGLETGAVILDLACGVGQQAVELASRGYSVVGFDLSLPMLSRAADEAQDRGQRINFLHGDMREMQFDEMFDGIYCWSTSFGYFDEERNLAVLQRIHRALRQGGNFLLDVVNRDYVASRAPSLVWFEGEGCTCMDDMYVDFFTSRLRVKRTAMFDDGHSRELDYSIRLYTLHELGKMLHETGFKVVEVTGHPAHPGVFFGAESPRMIILAERA